MCSFKLCPPPPPNKKSFLHLCTCRCHPIKCICYVAFFFTEGFSMIFGGIHNEPCMNNVCLNKLKGARNMTIRTKTDCKMLECCLNSNRKCFQSTKPLVTHSRLMIHARVVDIHFQCLEPLLRERKNTNIIL